MGELLIRPNFYWLSELDIILRHLLMSSLKLFMVQQMWASGKETNESSLSKYYGSVTALSTSTN